MRLVSRLKDKIFYGWVVVLIFLTIGVSLYGIRFTFGIFFKSIENEFELTRAATSAVISVSMVLSGVSAFIAGWALDKYGPKIVVLMMGLFTGLSLVLTGFTDSLWQIFITYSLLLAMGLGALFVVPMSVVSRWFDKKRGLALGIASSGVGLGMVIMAPFATYLIANFEWRTAYTVIGIIAWVVVIPLSRLLKKEPSEIGALPDGVKSKPTVPAEAGNDNQPYFLTLSQALKTRSFRIALIMWPLYSSNVFFMMTHLVPHITDIGFPPATAASILSLLGGATIAGRVLLGNISDRIGRKLTASICALLQAGGLALLVWGQELWMLYLVAFVYGFGFGGMSPVLAALAGDIFGLGSIGAILGMLEISFGFGGALGPFIGGIIYDVSGSYLPAFAASTIVMLTVALLVRLIKVEKYNLRREYHR
ncbi:MAG: MFS transporter [Chloroflexi bacterium]|nr:MFS transporter [Chloroflexota bacterium]